MSLTKKVFAKRAAIFSGLAVLFAVVSCAVLAAGPTLKNINPQGTVTSSSVSITLDTLDLARCRYSTSDTSYTSMGNDMYTPDGLYHSGLIGTLNHGSYTYYVRCQDFEGNENSTSAVVSFTVGDIGCIGSNCPCCFAACFKRDSAGAFRFFAHRHGNQQVCNTFGVH